MTEIEIWTIYKHPRDYPEKYVARKFINDKPTNQLISSITYDELIHILLSLYPYLTCLERVVVVWWGVCDVCGFDIIHNENNNNKELKK
jgi:hypothetical protein